MDDSEIFGLNSYESFTTLNNLCSTGFGVLLRYLDKAYVRVFEKFTMDLKVVSG